jgi:hypothetical protein
MGPEWIKYGGLRSSFQNEQTCSRNVEMFRLRLLDDVENNFRELKMRSMQKQIKGSNGQLT